MPVTVLQSDAAPLGPVVLHAAPRVDVYDPHRLGKAAEPVTLRAGEGQRRIEAERNGLNSEAIDFL